MGDVFPKVKLAAAQVAPVFLNREATVQKACEIILEAGRNGAGIIGFPECYIPGFPHWYQFFKAEDRESKMFFRELFKNAVVIPSPATDELCAAAREANVYVVMGLNEKEPGTTGTLYNTQLFISNNGEIMGKHRKLVPTNTERLVHTGGDGSTLNVFPTEYGELGGLICGENTNSLARYAMLAKGEKIHVAAWPAFVMPKSVHQHRAIDFRVQNHAFEGKLFAISVTGVFSEDMIDMMCPDDEARSLVIHDGGHSSIIGPKGEFLVEPSSGEKIIYADVDMEDCIEAKMSHDVIGHYNRFDIFRLTVNEERWEKIHYE